MELVCYTSYHHGKYAQNGHDGHAVYLLWLGRKKHLWFHQTNPVRKLSQIPSAKSCLNSKNI